MSDKGQLTWEILKDQLKKVRKDNWNKDRIIKEQETALAEHGMEIESLTAKLQAAEADRDEMTKVWGQACADADKAEAEVARLQTIMKDWQDNEDGSNYDFQIQRLLLEQTVQERDSATRTATEAALEWAAINPWDPDDQLELFEEYIDRGLAALLG